MRAWLKAVKNFFSFIWIIYFCLYLVIYYLFTFCLFVVSDWPVEYSVVVQNSFTSVFGKQMGTNHLKNYLRVQPAQTGLPCGLASGPESNAVGHSWNVDFSCLFLHSGHLVVNVDPEVNDGQEFTCPFVNSNRVKLLNLGFWCLAFTF